jgi:HEAT repeat protein
MRLCKGGAPERREAAIVALGGVLRGHPDATARELLLGYAEAGDGATALAALDALGAIGDTAAVSRLLRLADKRGNQSLRRRAVQALGDLGAPDEAARTLAALVKSDADPFVRSEAAWALGKHVHDPTLPALEMALRAAAPAVRANAVAALYRLGRTPAGLLPLVDDRDPAVRANAVLALAHTKAAAPAIARLAASDEDPRVRAAATRARAGAPGLPRNDWIAFSIVDFDGAPLTEARYRLILPDGLIKLGISDERGVVHEEGVPKGGCTLDLDDAPR